jgi:hypothetical protein
MHRKPLVFFAAAATLALAACSDSTSSPATIETDADITADVASSAGDAMATDVGEMIASEAFVGAALPSSPSFDLFDIPGLNVVRTRTCFDAQHAAQAQCDAQTTASIELTLAITGSFSNTRTTERGSEAVTAAVHRNRALTISGLAGTETFRLFNANGSSNDTTTFNGTHENVVTTRVMSESTLDSAQGVRFDLPHNTHPWPTLGVLIRNVAGKAVVTRNDSTQTREYSRRVTVTFPADAQGNVTITINNKTCTLNLVTRAVANCST